MARMARISIAAILLAAILTFTDGIAASADPPRKPAAETPQDRIDALILQRLEKSGIQPAALCDDPTFVRRVYIDVIGTLPTAEEVRTFLEDKDPDKRSKLIDRLLERDEYADYWAMRWSDVLRVKSEFPINLWPNAVQAYHRWIRTALARNMPYDRFVRELLTSSGSNFRVPPVNFYRAVQSNDPPALAKAVALTFMGDRMDSWSEDRRTGMATFFSRVGYKGTAEWKEEIVFFDVTTKAASSAMLHDGTRVKLSAGQDPREVFADWLISARNPWFARCIVNRCWYWLLGRGIIHEPDDLRPDNPPTHPEVLELLQKELVASKYDVKHVLRIILNSRTYQRSSTSRSKDPKTAGLFAYYPLRRLDAEVLIDALCQITGTTEEYSSRIPEPFTWVPKETRSIALPDGSITSSFLEMFGRPSRDTGMTSERSNGLTPEQMLHLLNSSHIRRKIEQSSTLRAARRQAWRNPDQAVTELYLAVLSRYPTADELKVTKSYVQAGRGKRGADPMADVMWALINSPEFLFRH